MGLQQLFGQSDLVGRAVALLLLALSLASWAVIVWKSWLLGRARRDVVRSVAAFWQAATPQEGAERVGRLDRRGLVLPLLVATQQPADDTLAAAGARAQQLTRALRDALQAVSARLQFGQVLLATTGAIAPFVGLLGTVWGIYQALASIAGSGQISVERIAGPVGEALIMTAAGLAVAIPAVLAYNWLGRAINAIEAELEGFAHDLRELLANDAAHDAAAGAAGMTR